MDNKSSLYVNSTQTDNYSKYIKTYDNHSNVLFNSGLVYFLMFLSNDTYLFGTNKSVFFVSIPRYIILIFCLIGLIYFIHEESIQKRKKQIAMYCALLLTFIAVSIVNKELVKIIDLLQEFKQQPITLLMPKMPEGSFSKKLFSLYLTYLPKEAFQYNLKMNCDSRGSFTELVHTADCGQVSINISKPGITKGQHWHNSKWEQFIVVHGHGLIQERNINTNEMVEFEVSGEKIEAVYMIPGWTHNIINLSETEDLVTVMTCNEVFNPQRPDTFGEPV